MNKRFYWLKLKEDFFQEDTIQWLEEQENGKEYCLFYLKLCLKSLKTNGVLVRYVGDMLMPYDAKKLASMTNTDYDTVVISLEVFKKIGLIEILENGEIYMKQLENMVGSETDKAVIMRKKRQIEKSKEKNKKKVLGNNVTPLLPDVTDELPDVTPVLSNSYTEKEKKSLEKDKEKELEKEQECVSSHFEQFWSLYPKPFNKELTYEAWKQLIVLEDPKTVIETTKRYIDTLADTEYKYIRASNNFLNVEWYKEYKESLVRVDKLKEQTVSKSNAQGENKRNTFNNFPQREYTKDHYEKMEQVLMNTTDFLFETK